MSLRWLTVSVALLAGPLPARAEDPLAITVEVPRRLQLGKKGYKGRIKVVIANRSGKPITFHHGEENYLVFEGEGGKLDLICHSCACMLQAEERAAARQFAVTIPPAGKKELRFEDWGCGGGPWPGPPAGAYRVSYRVFLERPRHATDPRRCCAALRETAFWKGSVSSTPVKLTIVGKGPR